MTLIGAKSIINPALPIEIKCNILVLQQTRIESLARSFDRIKSYDNKM